MRAMRMLTTTEAASLAAVTPSTIKRWADQGLLPSSRTAGGHRRFERFAIERVLRESVGSYPFDDPLVASWIRCLVDGRRPEIDGRLLEARSRLGAWCRVADELALALAEMGKQWECGRLTIAEEHAASDSLVRALARIGDGLPMRLDGPRCVLACAGEDEHTLGLSLAELSLREVGWTPLWLGRRMPAEEVIRVVRGGHVALVALSASAASSDGETLGRIAEEIGSACRDCGAGLVLGGAGAWPPHPSFGTRVTSCAALRDYLTEAMEER